MLRAYWNDLHTRQASVLAMIKQAPLGAYGAKKRRSFGTSPTEKNERTETNDNRTQYQKSS